MKKIKLGGLVKNKIGFSRWILNYSEYSKELSDYREDYEKIKLEFENRKMHLEEELNGLKKVSQNETDRLNEIIADKTNIIHNNVDALNMRNKEIEELHKELSDKLLEIDNLKQTIKQLNGQKGGYVKEINKLTKANEFLKANRRAPTKEEIEAYDKSQKEVLKRNKVKS